MESIVKGLLGLGHGPEATQILRIVMKHAPQTGLSEFSKGAVQSAAIKMMRQEADPLLRKTALCLLT